MPVATVPRDSITTGRTSVSRLGSNSGTVIQQKTHTTDASVPSQFKDSTITHKPSPSSITDNATGSKHERPSIDFLEEHPLESLPGPVPGRPTPPGAFRLMSPVWIRKGGGSGSSSSGGLPRRSKKGQINAPKADKRRYVVTESGKSDDDVSPTSSAGPSSPSTRARSPGPVHQSLGHTLDGSAEPSGSAMNVRDTPPPRIPGGSAGADADSMTQAKSKATRQSKSFDQGMQSSVEEDKPKRKRKSPRVSEDALRLQSAPPRESIALPSPSEAQSLPSSHSSIARKETDSRRGGTGVRSLLCSPLPSPFRRNRADSTSRAYGPISIYQGLVKPGSDPPQLLRADQTNMDDESNSNTSHTGNRVVGGNKTKVLSWLPKRLRKLSIIRDKNKKTPFESVAENKSSGKKPSNFSELPNGTTRTEDKPQPENSTYSSQRPSKGGPLTMLGKVSFTLKGRSAAEKGNSKGAESSLTTKAHKEDSIHGSSRGPRSTHQSREERRRHRAGQQLTSDSLRNRLKAELGPDISMDVLPENQVMRQNQDLQTQGTGAKDLPTPGIRRVSRKWNNENPFEASADWAMKESNDSEYADHKDHYGSQRGKSADQDRGDEFTEVALASVPGDRRVYTHNNSGPTSTGAFDSLKGKSDDRSGDGGQPVVVANAECVLVHPRPSRQSEQEMIKVLCKEVCEESEDQQGHRRKSEVSEGSSASYHTAPMSILSVS